ncbi:MAG: N-carbamoyl-L-amino-acid hydrolase [Candidatus Celerinatantimonas neptuna]|nr:MAG: N-carbamoyl-L-amino-acid hydrolase [Candidatus Celerinatantimonas neptuna]
MLSINIERLSGFLASMAEIGASANGGCNRQALTKLDQQGRALFIQWCRAIGGRPRLDEVGNLFVRWTGRDDTLAPVVMGSHLDTQSTGGRFDGVYGVLAALEVMYCLHENQQQLERPIEIVVWMNEEGARFRPAMMGSGVFAAAFDQQTIYETTDSDGVSVYQALCEAGQLGDEPCVPFDIHAALELHIEQGPILERSCIPVGVVEGVQGMNWFTVTLKGQSVHAGPTPMDMRCDPVQALPELLQQCYALADDDPATRVTIGALSALPGATNTVPESVQFSVDLRHPHQEILDELSHQLSILCDSDMGNISCELKMIWRSPAVHFDSHCIQTVRQSCTYLGIPSMPIISGAGHDSVYLSRVAPTSMIFIPCKDGISHNENEYATPDDLETGANVLLHSVLALASEKENIL